MTLSSDKNYIIAVVPLDATTQIDISGTQVAFHGDAKGLATIQYFDGLGRPTETVQRGITPAGKDLATYIEYDGVGRQYREWLPAPADPGNSGAYVNLSTFIVNTASQYGSSEKPYSEAILESSPLDRVLGKKDPGTAWETHPTEISYDANTAGEVKYFYADNNYQLVTGTPYDAATLYKTTSKDEDGK